MEKYLSDREIVDIVLKTYTESEYKRYSPSILSIWRPRLNAASDHSLKWIEEKYNKQGSYAFIAMNNVNNCIEDKKEFYCSNNIKHQVKVLRNQDQSYHVTCMDCNWWENRKTINE